VPDVGGGQHVGAGRRTGDRGAAVTGGHTSTRAPITINSCSLSPLEFIDSHDVPLEPGREHRATTILTTDTANDPDRVDDARVEYRRHGKAAPTGGGLTALLAANLETASRRAYVGSRPILHTASPAPLAATARSANGASCVAWSCRTRASSPVRASGPQSTSSTSTSTPAGRRPLATTEGLVGTALKPASCFSSLSASTVSSSINGSDSATRFTRRREGDRDRGSVHAGAPRPGSLEEACGRRSAGRRPRRSRPRGAARASLPG